MTSRNDSLELIDADLTTITPALSAPRVLTDFVAKPWCFHSTSPT